MRPLAQALSGAAVTLALLSAPAAVAADELKVGDAAPDFTLRSHDGREITLSKLRGSNVVLAFFAFAFTNT